jgi:hypothetical protein
LFKNISELPDKSAEGIVKAVDTGEIADDVRNRDVIKEARAHVAEGKGDTIYIGSRYGKPKWKEPEA